VVAVIAGAAGKLAARIGFRRVLLFGATCFAVGLGSYVVRVGTAPNYLGEWLPGTLLVGVGIGFTFPVLSAGAVSALPPARFAVGSAVNQTARQIGGALGIATLVALIGLQRHLADPLDGFHQLWTFAAATAITSGVIGSFIPRPSPHKATQIDRVADELLAIETDVLPLAVELP
jgi:MFS family permease